ncbi:NADH dehydrogenase [ubiquinone] 1 beta subcomplex subunit 6 [Labeo rohita]|uniref:NADH dehydrogenase [ubiquinone] 1 beta subcomplex subunit 6 n=1 Tax=Labeo rohita TaxID=84645 RepID=A0ABQ8N0D4_LABRO|nr:NADH dehydrogenase [ubiquinone] 1 beta subcomplex subunit 6 [Labeo rohita]
MTGYTADEKLRFEQLTKLRRQWLKDQELSPREPVVAPKKTRAHRAILVWIFAAQDTLEIIPYNAGVFAVTRILIPAWIVHYYVKYHVSGDTILETGEVVPDLPEADGHGHH